MCSGDRSGPSRVGYRTPRNLLGAWSTKYNEAACDGVTPMGEAPSQIQKFRAEKIWFDVPGTDDRKDEAGRKAVPKVS